MNYQELIQYMIDNAEEIYYEQENIHYLGFFPLKPEFTNHSSELRTEGYITEVNQQEQFISYDYFWY